MVVSAGLTGRRIQFKDGQFVVPDDPIIPFIEGDGIGVDIWAASVRVIAAGEPWAHSIPA